MFLRAALIAAIAVTSSSNDTNMPADLEEFRKELISALEIPEAVAVIRDLFAFLAKPLNEVDPAAAQDLANVAGASLANLISDDRLLGEEAETSRVPRNKRREAGDAIGDVTRTLEEKDDEEEAEKPTRVPRKKKRESVDSLDGDKVETSEKVEKVRRTKKEKQVRENEDAKALGDDESIPDPKDLEDVEPLGNAEISKSLRQ